MLLFVVLINIVWWITAYGLIHPTVTIFFASPAGEADQAQPGRVRGIKKPSSIMYFMLIRAPSPAATRRPLPGGEVKTAGARL